ncbi:MAG: LLM class flavin-dependent oxidoreductase, partial [Microbacterium gubbeenense]
LADDDRYARAESFTDAVFALWDAAGTGEEVRVSDEFFDIAARPTVPPTPQGRPVVMQAGVSPEGREIAARYADAIFSPFAAGPAAEDFAADMRRRLTAHGRADDALKILPGTGFALGDTHEEALEQAERDRWDQVSPATAVRQIETIWGRRFEGFDAEG